MATIIVHTLLDRHLSQVTVASYGEHRGQESLEAKDKVSHFGELELITAASAAAPPLPGVAAAASAGCMRRSRRRRRRKRRM